MVARTSAEGGLSLGWGGGGGRDGEVLQGSVSCYSIWEEEAEVPSVCTHCQRLHPSESLTHGVLDMVVPVSTEHTHSGLHLFCT